MVTSNAEVRCSNPVIMSIFSENCWKDEHKEKDAGSGPFLKVIDIVPTWTVHILGAFGTEQSLQIQDITGSNPVVGNSYGTLSSVNWVAKAKVKKEMAHFWTQKQFTFLCLF